MYKLKRMKPFGTVRKGNSIIGETVAVYEGSVVNEVERPWPDMFMASYTDNLGRVVYGWVFMDEVEEVG